MLEQRAIAQNNEQERLNQWAKELEKKQMELQENEIRLAFSAENQRLHVGVRPPKVGKRTGIFRRIALFALNHSNTLVASNVTKMAISRPTGQFHSTNIVHQLKSKSFFSTRFSSYFHS